MAQGLQVLTFTNCSQESAEEFKQTKVGSEGYLRIPMEGRYYNVATLYIACIRITPNK